MAGRCDGETQRYDEQAQLDPVPMVERGRWCPLAPIRRWRAEGNLRLITACVSMVALSATGCSSPGEPPNQAGTNAMGGSTNTLGQGGAGHPSATASTSSRSLNPGGSSGDSRGFSGSPHDSATQVYGGGTGSQPEANSGGMRGDVQDDVRNAGGTVAQTRTVHAAGSTGTIGEHHHGHNETGYAGAPMLSGSSQAGSGTTADHCVDGERADPRDLHMSAGPERWTSTTGEVDLVLPQPVLDWMTERLWQPSHDAWHNVRRCLGGTPIPGATTNVICSHSELVAEHQECEDAEDGYQFLVMHRHMIQSLKQAFPSHADLFNGFARFPDSASGVPEEWQGRWGDGWPQPIREMGELLEDIERNLAQFLSEGDLGRYIQCSSAGTPFSSIHGALHFKWVVNESPHSLGKQPVNIENYMFWKLHGWIDDIWERYRRAKGLDSGHDRLRMAIIGQCREMHTLGAFVASNPGPSNEALPDERGYFHERVRPILEKMCSGCHGEKGPQAAMSLTGKISSADIVKGLVNVKSMYGGQYYRVMPGAPEQSWLYLKASGLAATADCQGTNCSSGVMPPTSGQVTLSDSEIETIRQWILDGAPPPTSL